MRKRYHWLTCLLLCCSGAFAIDRNVANMTALNSAIAAAQPGDRIILQNGVWNNAAITFSSSGTAASLSKCGRRRPEALSFQELDAHRHRDLPRRARF